jgi:hypothetical protein
MKEIVIHHTTDSLSQKISDLEIKERWLGYYSMPYHFIIWWDWIIYEWRPLEFKWDHVALKNTWKIWIALMWDFESRKENFWSPDKPTTKQIESLKILTWKLVKLFKIQVENINWHYEYVETLCPWENLKEKIDEVRDASKYTVQSVSNSCNKINNLESELNNLKLYLNKQ